MELKRNIGQNQDRERKVIDLHIQNLTSDRVNIHNSVNVDDRNFVSIVQLYIMQGMMRAIREPSS